MKYPYLLLAALLTSLGSGCASQPAQTDQSAAAPAAKASPKESAKESPKAEAAPAGEIVGKPAKGSKFAKLKLGMKLKEVEKLIGKPTSQWQRPTGKAHIPFYFGDDRWVVEYAYSKEGQLTFNYGGDQVLVRIAVNKNQ